ncbi:hypothetical protein GLP25_17970 [Photobacterium phosphoreum]|uniref:glycosyltransferase family 52 protein n=1 Tax=Photobacterium phosphoreum TaxID=659 RepID=UPI001E5A2F39|nr:glycosyltransferase family 52 protein [Photobacterium phosphoreum]MCD9485054.1 hypothetical protein [Photobacterium phosphoreum]
MIIVKAKIKNKNTENILYVNSLYSLSLYVYINDDKYNNTLFIVGNDIYSERIFEKIDNYIVVNMTYRPSRFDVFLCSIYIIPEKFHYIYSIIKKAKYLYGHDHLPLSGIMLSFKGSMILIEDGLKNHMNKRLSKSKVLIRSVIGNVSEPLGYDKRINKIYLTGLGVSNFSLNEKIELVNYNKFINSITHQLDGAFKYSFSTNKKYIKPIAILATQPLSEDQHLSEDEKIKIYDKILKKLEVQFTVYIKAHPREVTDYKIITNNIIPNDYLIETFILNESVVSIFSLFSSFFGCRDLNEMISIIQFGTYFNKNLIDKFGLIKCSDNNYDYIFDDVSL